MKRSAKIIAISAASESMYASIRWPFREATTTTNTIGNSVLVTRSATSSTWSRHCVGASLAGRPAAMKPRAAAYPKRCLYADRVAQEAAHVLAATEQRAEDAGVELHVRADAVGEAAVE